MEGGVNTPQKVKNSQAGLANRAKGGKRSQRKGADGERELAAILREYGYPIERGGSMSFYSAKIHNFPRKEISTNGIDAKPTEGNRGAAVQPVP